MHKGFYIIGLLLLLVACTNNEQAKGDRMRALMELTAEKNRLEKPLPSDTTFREVVDYFDEYGTANQRMKARYLMGCIYRDMHEAPMALQYLLDAAGQADTQADTLPGSR